MKIILLLSLILSGFVLWGVEDEPSELSWDFFSHDVNIFYHFLQFQSKNPLPVAKVEDCPKEFPAVTVRPEDFQIPASNWQLAKHQSTTVLQARPGHHGDIVRAKLQINEPGLYRVWVKYYHTKGYCSSFALRILAPELLKETMPQIVSTKGEFYNYRFDWSEYSAKRPSPLPNRKEMPTGFLWESGQMVELGPGEYTVEVAGLVHNGPFAARKIAMIVLTADPLVEGIDEIIGNSSYPASDPTRQFWNEWCQRPGAVPIETLDPTRQNYYLKWRTAFLKKLIENPETDAEKRLATQSYFDENVNLIGTSADVTNEKQHIETELKNIFPKAFVTEIEAEDMQLLEGCKFNWEIKNSNDASGSKILQSNYGDGPATASTIINIPKAGRYWVWARYSLLHKYFSMFDLKFYNVNGTLLSTLNYGLPEDRMKRKNNQFSWELLMVELPAGKLELRLCKNIGKAPNTYRRVDKFFITDSDYFNPESYQKKVSAQPNTLWVQKDTWGGFSRTSQPDKADIIEPREIALKIHQGDTASVLMHFRNDTLNPEMIVPKASGIGAPRIRLVSYMKTPLYSWSPVILLERSRIIAPPRQNASIWLSFASENLPAGNYTPELLIGSRKIKFMLSVIPTDNKRAVPIVGGWCKPLERESCWALFREIGINLLFQVVVSRHEMEQYRIKHFAISFPKFDSSTLQMYIAKFHMIGLTEKDWSLILFDEPCKKNVEKWLALAQQVRTATPAVQIWCNPGEVQASTPDTVRQMRPYIDVFCPYLDHFSSKDKTYQDEELSEIGKIKLLYTTPCFQEKSPSSPKDLLYLGEMAIKYRRHGWALFSLFCSYPYSNSIWDEMYAFNAAQSISYYPGAYGRTLSTRNLEAVREAIQRYRK